MNNINNKATKLDNYIKSIYYLWISDLFSGAVVLISLILLTSLFCIMYLLCIGFRDFVVLIIIFCSPYLFPLIVLPNILISSFINSKRALARINRIANNQTEILNWKNKFMSCSSVKLIDLIVAKRFDILESEEYQIKKHIYISQFTNWLNRTKYISKHQIDKLSSENRHQYDVDKPSFIALANLRNELDIDDHEFAIIRNNFVNNFMLINKSALNKLKHNGIISGEEYRGKRINVIQQHKWLLIWLFKMSLLISVSLIVSIRILALLKGVKL